MIEENQRKKNNFLKCQKEYELIEARELPDIASYGYLMKHRKSKARLFLIENQDENKVFNICFRTPAPDDTGVPHILEHSVLCGSKKFPAKDPFVELVKGSLNTFLNAMTYPDHTMYPVASCNDKDFQNLMDVYMDAVLNPNIYKREEIFRQEGWSYSLEDPEKDIIYNGVVYNEMKGAFSSADDMLYREILNSLFPDTSYANESGGDPESIPDLKYEEFLEFHRKYYHPSNSYIYLYGNMDMEEKLLWLDREYLSHYDFLSVSSEIFEQKPFTQIREVEKSYSISDGENEQDNAFLSYNVVIESILKKEINLTFNILEYVLISAPGAPLKKALIDAGIGKDVYGGFQADTRQTIFSIVAKNTNIEEKERFLSIIEETLKKLVNEGIDKDALEAAINYLEFSYREADFGRSPKGLIFGIQAIGTWIYDESEPFQKLELNQLFPLMKEKINTRYFEECIQKYLLENSAVNLKNLIVAYLQIFDFINFGKFAKKYIDSKYPCYQDVQMAMDEIKNLLYSVKRTLKSRTQRDIIIIWNDQLDYNWLQYAPYLQKTANESMFFENAYTSAPFTIPVFLEMFQGLKPIDNEIYHKPFPAASSTNSKLIKELESSGYSFVYIGDEADARLFEEKYVISNYAYSSSCIRCVNLLQKLLDSEKPVCVILHELVETHNPYLSGGLDNSKYYEWPAFGGESEEAAMEQRKKSVLYWDKQLEFYINFMPDRCIKIFMSDHGARYNFQPIYKEATTHIIFFITGMDTPKGRYKKLFSIYNFYKVIKCILYNEYRENEIFSDYILIQETSVFNNTAICYYTENNAKENSYAFRAVRTEKELYVKLSSGKKYYYILPDEEINCIGKTDKERLVWLDRLAGNKFENLGKHEKEIERFRKQFETHE